MPSAQRTVERSFNTDAFTGVQPAPQALGNAGLGIIRGRRLANFDVSIAKKIPVDENHYFQFRTELFNALDHANFGAPRIFAGKPRRLAKSFRTELTNIQFGLKLYFESKVMKTSETSEQNASSLAGRPAPYG